MTEQEWLTCTAPRPMLRFLVGKASDRKLRLFAVACCRRIWHLLPDPWSRHAVEVAERYADGQATDQELESAAADACDVYDAEVSRAEIGAKQPGEFDDTFVHSPSLAAYTVAVPIGWWGAAPAFVAPHEIACEAVPDSETEAAVQCGLLRDIFGNPFQRVHLDPAYRTRRVIMLAQTVYEDRAFDRLPVLANALEQAGCQDSDILAHCRGPGPHIRGCWPVDLLLGKAASPS